MSDPGRITVVIDEDLADLVPDYLEHRVMDVVSIRSAAGNGDFETVRILGHSMKGSGGGYGFDAITSIGSDLEQAGAQSDHGAATAGAAALEDYLVRLEVRYE